MHYRCILRTEAALLMYSSMIPCWIIIKHNIVIITSKDRVWVTVYQNIVPSGEAPFWIDIHILQMSQCHVSYMLRMRDCCFYDLVVVVQNSHARSQSFCLGMRNPEDRRNTHGSACGRCSVWMSMNTLCNKMAFSLVLIKMCTWEA